MVTSPINRNKIEIYKVVIVPSKTVGCITGMLCTAVSENSGGF